MVNEAQGAARLLEGGFAPHIDALASVRDYADATAGGRVIEVRLAGGLSFEVLPDRGLDIGAVWWAGFPISWRSPQDAGHASSAGAEDPWLTRWGGGLLTTCGPDNIGPARDGYGLHGSHHATSAAEVRWLREVRGAHIVVVVSGTISNVEMFGRRIAIHREIEARTDIPSLEIRDRIYNKGYEAVPVPLLYHLNFGAPFIEPGSRVQIASEQVIKREECTAVPDPAQFPHPTDEMVEAVFEHRYPESNGRQRQAIIHSRARGGRAVLSWSRVSLPRLYQWVWPTRGGWALGVEPANAPLFGAERDLPGAGAPLLPPGTSIDTWVRLGCEVDDW